MPKGYRFFAASHRFNRLDGQVFRNAREAERAARRMPMAARDGGVTSRADLLGTETQSLVAERDNSFQSLPCFCQFIRMGRFCGVFLPSVNSCSPTKLKRTMAAGPTTRTVGFLYSSDRPFVVRVLDACQKLRLVVDSRRWSGCS